MKPLTKHPEPAVLVTNGAEWTSSYVAAAPHNRKRLERWGHEEIRATLSDETYGKCAYCESTVGHVSYPNVEHILPKSKFPELAHIWSNLTSACTKCNNSKSDYHEPDLAVFNPYTDDVEGRLVYWGDFVDWPFGDDRAEVTVRKLDLNRLDLRNERIDRIASVREMLQRWHDAVGSKRELLAEAIRLDAEQGTFSRAVRAYLISRGFPLLASP